MAQIARWLQLWSPLAKKMLNVAIVKPDGEVATTPNETGEALKEHWAKVFSEQLASLGKGREILEMYGVKLELSNVAMLGQTEIDRFLRGARYSAPGPDGLPYGCWRGTGAVGSRVLYRVLVAIASGVAAPSGFNWSLGMYPKTATQQPRLKERPKTLDR